MILLTLSRGKGEETVRLQLPASPAEIGETFAFLDRISLDTTATAILDVSSNVPVLYRCLYDVDVEDSEQFQKLQKLAERTEALSPAKAAIFSGALDAECVWNLEGALTVADRLDEYMLVNNVSSDSELGIYLVNKGITPFPDRFKPYINYARVGAEYRLIAVKAGTILVEERLCVDRLLGRLRFTCAHELGHWVLHQKLYSGTGDVAAYEGKTSLDESHGLVEWQADALATALLMPLPQIKRSFYRLRAGRSNEQLVAEMAQIFQVSKQAMRIRLETRNLI